MTNPVRVSIYRLDDWNGLYVDGILTDYGHEISMHDWQRLIDKYKYFDGVDIYWIDDFSDEFEELFGSNFPDLESQIPSVWRS